MPQTKHTPGPWFGRKDGKFSMSCPWSIDHEDGHNASWLPVTDEKRRTLALVVNDDTLRMMESHDAEMHANCKLIAAAPELLEACIQARAVLRTVLADITDQTGTGVVQRKIELLSATISKATE